MRDGVKRIDSLIHDLLEYSRVVQTATDQHPVDAERIARQAVELCRTSVHESHATIEIATLPAVLAVDAQVLQVFQNLISNALKYRRDGVAPLIRIAGETQDRSGTRNLPADRRAIWWAHLGGFAGR